MAWGVTAWFIFGVVAIAVLVLAWSELRNPRDPDAFVLAQMKREGTNLTEPHFIKFFLALPTREAADRIAVKVAELDFAIEVRPDDESPDWQVVAKKTMVPTQTELNALRKRFEAWTKAEQGDYEGWYAPGTETRTSA